MTTRESLGIFWQGAEADGFTVYGYWPRAAQPNPQLAFDGWSDVDHKISKLYGDEWTVWFWDVRIRTWPVANRWPSLVNGLLEQLLRAEAVVAWCATEGSFVDPPCLFEPHRTERTVWTARTGRGDAFGPPDLEGPFNTLTDDELVTLRVAAGMGPCVGDES
jgi:hypothetical protein